MNTDSNSMAVNVAINAVGTAFAHTCTSNVPRAIAIPNSATKPSEKGNDQEHIGHDAGLRNLVAELAHVHGRHQHDLT